LPTRCRESLGLPKCQCQLNRISNEQCGRLLHPFKLISRPHNKLMCEPLDIRTSGKRGSFKAAKNLKLSDYGQLHHIVSGRDSSVGIATAYGMDGPVIEFRWGRDFPHLSRPALRSTQPSVQWVPGLSRG
jgi:hypothetical protein